MALGGVELGGTDFHCLVDLTTNDNVIVCYHVRPTHSHHLSADLIHRPPKGTTKKKPVADGTGATHTPTLAKQLSLLHLPRPFKNPAFTKNTNRRTKNLKTVLGQERERERAERERRRAARDLVNAMDVDEEGGVGQEEIPTYTSIEAPPSLLPQRHYCDITGLEAPYTDPRTGLRYHDKSVYDLIKHLSPSVAKDYLSARGVNPIVK
ncbi:hypothetical protein JVU11DRAFT_8285 [Chiua virens]|nr:hypothetical protein JVU11DRAFT_8285 [Chiua virens]